MAKLNWLVQLSVVNKQIGFGQPVWVDCGGCSGKDNHGNPGYQSKAAAKVALAECRSNYPNEAYRLIRITE